MLRTLRHRDFRLLWMGQSVSLIGDGIYLVAIAWLVYDITNEPGALALVGLAWTLPMVLALLFSGVLSDRFERRRLLVLSDLVRGAAIAAIAVLTLTGVVELWQVVVLVVVYGIGEALFQPAFSAIVPDVVPREQLLQANSLRELMEPLGLRFAGPAVGGLLITVFDVGTAFLVDALTFAASAVVVSFMSRQPPPREESHTFRKDLSEGFAYVRDHAWLWATLTGARCSCSSPMGRSRSCCPTSSATTWMGAPQPSAPSWRPAAWARSPLLCCSAARVLHDAT